MEKIIEFLEKNPQEVHWCSLSHIKTHVHRAGISIYGIKDDEFHNLLLQAGYKYVEVSGHFYGYVVASTNVI